MSGYEPQSVDTVKVVSDLFESGYIIINAEDFDEEIHELFSEQDVAAAEAAVAPKRKR